MESTPLLIPHQSGKKYPLPLTLGWRVNHSIGYLIGGTTFVAGSVCYFPGFTHLVAGGWLFTIGSTGFLFADIYEWNKNNRVGCWNVDQGEADDFEAAFVVDHPHVGHTCYGSYLRMENGINFAFSAFGSLLYLIGSVLFIPALDAIVLGTQVFIVGSLVIFLSQTWKCYRCLTHHHTKKNFHELDTPAFGVDVFAGLGGLAYMIGSIFFLPQIDVSDDVTFRAACWFTAGGTFFTVSGLFSKTIAMPLHFLLVCC